MKRSKTKRSADVAASAEQKAEARIMNHNQYTTSCGKWKTLFAVLFLLAVLTAWVVTLATEKESETWDSIHPIPNANISWDQTFYGGVKAD